MSATKAGPNKEPVKELSAVMTEADMQDQIKCLHVELEEEMTEISSLQLEIKMLRSLYEISEKRLGFTRDALQDLDEEIEEDEQRHQDAILNIAETDVKRLCLNLDQYVCAVRADRLRSTEAAQKEKDSFKREVRGRIRCIMVDMQECNPEAPVKTLVLQHQEDVDQMRDITERKLKEVEAHEKKKLESLRQELTHRMLTVISERQNFLNGHITALLAEQRCRFRETVAEIDSNMKEATSANESLRMKIKHLEAQREEREELKTEVLEDTKRLSECFLEVKEETTQFEKLLRNPLKEKDPHERLVEAEREERLQEHEELQLRFHRLKTERDELLRQAASTASR
ncbi:dynein regulatory complex subunit 4-like [Aulostomus maculatus]